MARLCARMPVARPQRRLQSCSATLISCLASGRAQRKRAPKWRSHSSEHLKHNGSLRSAATETG
eukprot:7391774-Pyramimonas_sp.AAC.1